MRRKRLLVVGFGAGMERSLPQLADMGLELSIVTEAENELTRRWAAQTILADPADGEEVVAAVGRAALTQVDGVMSLGFDNPPAIARLCSAFGCVGLSEQAAWDCTLKDRRIRLFERHGVSSPRYRIASSEKEGLAAIDQLGLPVVVKPTDRSSSLGVVKVSSRERAPEGIAVALDASRSGRVVVEEFLAGTEHTVIGFCLQGRAVFTGVLDRDYSQKELFAPHFFERGDTLPTALSSRAVEKVKDTVRRGLRALSLEPAFFNADVLVTTRGEAVLLELAGRITGARIATELVPLGTGVDCLSNAARLALGEELDEHAFIPCRDQAVVQRFLPSNGECVQWVGDIDTVPRPEGLYDLFWSLRPRVGCRLPPYRSSDDNLAGAIATATAVEHAEQVAIDALARLPLRTA